MSTIINVTDVNVLDNPSVFTNPFQLEITFECLEELRDDLEWKLIYVGSAYDQSADQELDSILVGPIPVGMNKIVFQADAPDHTKIEPADLIGPTVVLLTCSYMEQEFIRIGYYVNNEYIDPEMQESPPAEPRLDLVRREILADQPRVTRFDIHWNKSPEDGAGSACMVGEEGGMMEGGMMEGSMMGAEGGGARQEGGRAMMGGDDMAGGEHDMMAYDAGTMCA